MDNKAIENPKSVWKQFRKNRIALIAGVLIISSFVLSLVAYWVIPDNAPNANTQFATIGLKEPGFTTSCLRVEKNIPFKKASWLQSLLGGSTKSYESIPFKDIVFSETSIQITNYFNRPVFYNYEDVLFALDLSSKSIHNKGAVTFVPLNHQKQTASLKDLTDRCKQQIIQKTFWLGTDKYGRDILSRIILGIRISIFVGLLSVILSLFIGISLGAIAGYFGGKIDQLIMLVLNVNWSIPTLLMVFAIVLAFNRGIMIIFLAIGLTMWVEVARLVRTQVKEVKEESYIQACKNLGYDSKRVILRHILPNIIGPILVIAVANFSTAVLVEAGLSYLGFGVTPPTPSIGNILNEHYGYAVTGKVFLAIIPACTIMFLVLAFNLVGSGLRDAFDVKR